MRFPSLRPAVALTGLALLACAPATQANIIIATPPSVAPDAGGFRFSYNVFYDGSDFSPFLTITLEPGDFFTIYDFAGFVPGTNLPLADWTFSSALTGVNPSGTTAPDNAAVPNLTWTYTGASRIADGPLGTFSAVSLLGGTAPGFFAGQDTQTIFGTAAPGSNVIPGARLVPAAAAIPEPGSLALVASGLLPLLGMAARRRRG